MAIWMRSRMLFSNSSSSDECAIVPRVDRKAPRQVRSVFRGAARTARRDVGQGRSGHMS